MQTLIKELKYLVPTIGICLLAWTAAFCALLFSVHEGASAMRATQLAAIQQNEKASVSRAALAETLRALQSEIIRMDVAIDERQMRLEAKIDARHK
jgi:hypothetical protein